MQTETEGLGKDISCKRGPKESRRAILISDKIECEIKTMIRDKEGHYIMIKGSIQKEDITIINIYAPKKVFPHCSVCKESACNGGDPSSIPGLGRSTGEGIGDPLQYSWLENPTDRGSWKAAVHRVTESQTRMKQLAGTQACWVHKYL